MCHGHPRTHPCSHTSVTWHYCPSALIDLETGYETACANMSFAKPQPSKTRCPLANCGFKAHGGRAWTCCACRQGPNDRGWCTNVTVERVTNPRTGLAECYQRSCDHGCCSNCTPVNTNGGSESPPGTDGYGGARSTYGYSSTGPAFSSSSASSSSSLSWSSRRTASSSGPYPLAAPAEEEGGEEGEDMYYGYDEHTGEEAAAAAAEPSSSGRTKKSSSSSSSSGDSKKKNGSSRGSRSSNNRSAGYAVDLDYTSTGKSKKSSRKYKSRHN